MERVGVLTGGGDCPGLNAVIRGVVRKALQNNIKVVGIKNGWKGLVTTDTVDLDLNAIAGILPKGGTILGTSRTNPYKSGHCRRKVGRKVFYDCCSINNRNHFSGCQAAVVPENCCNSTRGATHGSQLDRGRCAVW